MTLPFWWRYLSQKGVLSRLSSGATKGGSWMACVWWAGKQVQEKRATDSSHTARTTLQVLQLWPGAVRGAHRHFCIFCHLRWASLAPCFTAAVWWQPVCSPDLLYHSFCFSVS